MDQLAKLAQLKALFTSANVVYLDAILELLLQGTGPIHSMFWAEFKRRFPQDSDVHYTRAWNALLRLRDLVKSEL